MSWLMLADLLQHENNCGVLINCFKWLYLTNLDHRYQNILSGMLSGMHCLNYQLWFMQNKK